MTAKSNAQNQAAYRANRADKGQKEIRHVISIEVANQLAEAVKAGKTVDEIIKKGLAIKAKKKVTHKVSRNIEVAKRNLMGQVIAPT